MFPHNNHNQFMPQAPPPPHFPTSALADVGSNGRGGGVGNALGMGIGNIAPVSGMGQIDWAQLAQQWIHMRDQTVTTTTPGPPAPPNFGIIPLAPPPPFISNAPEYQRQQLSNLHYEEHGEADMDMDDDTERGHGIDMQISTPPPAPLVSNQISHSDSNASAGRGKQQQLEQQQWTNWPGQSNKQAINNPTAHIPSLLKLNVSNPNEPHGLGHHHQSLPSQQQQMPPQTQQQQQQQQQSEVSNMGGSASEIDTNKRKMLPAWIREGLEKMEREKQRQLEREQPITSTNMDLLGSSTDPENHHQQQGQNVKQVSSKTLTTPVNLMNLKNVASDSEDSNEELSENAPGSAQLNKGKDMLIRRTTRKRIDSQSTEHTQDNQNEEQEEDEELPPRSEIRNDAISKRQARQVHDNGKNYEERLADLMMVVRRTLTEILLETTNEEIAIIANETMKAHRAKASSAQVIRKSALSSITGNLGLAAYGDSSSESEGDDDDDDDDAHKDSDDDDRIGNTTDLGKNLQQLSAEELKARIRRSKRSFEKVIIDIEHRVAQQEQRDELVLEKQRKLEMERMAERRKESGSQRESRTEPMAESLILGSSNDKVKLFNGKRPSRKERTTRFSDNKDGKQTNQSFVQHVVAAAASAPASMPTITSSSSAAVPSKMKPIPNVATNLLQMPESVANMLSAADKALQKANKSSDRISKRRRRSSTTSSSSSSSGSGSGSSSSTSSTSSSSYSSTSGTTKSSSSRSVNSKKKTTSSSKSRRTAASSSNSRRNHHQHHHQRDQDEGSSRSRSRNKYERREHDRERERRHHYGGSSSNTHRRRPNKRDSSHSGDEHRANRHRSSRHGDYAKAKRHHTRSRSRSRSRNSQQHHQHHSTKSHSSSSSASHHRKRV